MGQSRTCLSRRSPGNMSEMRMLEEKEIGGAGQQFSHGEFSLLVACVNSQIWKLPSFLRLRLRVLKLSHRALKISFPSRKAKQQTTGARSSEDAAEQTPSLRPIQERKF